MGSMFHVRVHQEVENKMRKIAEDAGGTLSHHVNEAIKAYLEENRDMILASQAVLNHQISHEEVRKILEHVRA